MRIMEYKVKYKPAAYLLSFFIMLAACFFGGGTVKNASAADTSAQSMAVMEAESGRVLAAHNADVKLPMASTTKVVTASVLCWGKKNPYAGVLYNIGVLGRCGAKYW